MSARPCIIVLVVAACGGHGGPTPGVDAGPAAVAVSFTDDGAPAHIASLTFDLAGRPVVFATDGASAGPYALERGDGTTWVTETHVTADKAFDAQFFRDPDGAPVAVVAAGGDNFDLWRLDDEDSFAWQKTSMPTPQLSGAWHVIGEDATGRFTAVIDGASLALVTWSRGDSDWVLVPGSSEPGVEQGSLVTPSGAAFMSFSPPGEEGFTYQRFDGAAPEGLQPCTAGAPTVLSDYGTFDDASDVLYASCENNALYSIPKGGNCYEPVVDLPDGACGATQATPDGTVFLYPSTIGETEIYRHLPGASGWTTFESADIDGTSGFQARDATTLFRFGGNHPGLATATLPD